MQSNQSPNDDDDDDDDKKDNEDTIEEEKINTMDDREFDDHPDPYYEKKTVLKSFNLLLRIRS